MRQRLPAILSLNAGYVDTAGFLALQGLFTAHVTGNFVTLGASLVHGTSGAAAKLLALPVFCLVVVLIRLAAEPFGGSPWRLRAVLGVELALLMAGGAMAIRWGPFPNGDSWEALLTGMVLVAAMAVQNAVQRVHLANFPPTTMMTGNTTQIMTDLADLLHGLPPAPILARLRRIVPGVVGFILGCAAGATLFVTVDMLCFAVPPVIGALAIIVATRE
jgi:uncharacterized membrane protein YoaK (UPF0700 family)